MNVEFSPNQPRIEADGFVLRPLRISDAGLISLYAGDSRVACMTRSIPHPLPPGAAEAMIARAQAPDRTEDIWAMDSSAAGGTEVMGLMGLERLDRAQSQVSFWVAPAFWNTGVASAALGAMLVSNPHAAQTMFAEVFQDNPASARVLTNAGFAYLGDAENFSVARGAKVPTWTYTRKLS
ncbi:GNAT family N-acetyltransferase [Lutimaribacter saemankumensis]|uniref:Protein N-acetyltransferase, RimJ/RimL family n=1 Tax=Lutimaribacter saemankumensis TaxID=490829 RepID=A0A1G8GJ85_9RHOB|nr:GNAT family protein [Lutimaribacter saemankumensis]SDH94459.1 Protein N-acetyltransferase, RimJ/RimL family [Lutimaribacter saemankumensis]